MTTDAENEAYFTARYAEARAIFPLLSYPTFTHNPAGAITTEELNVAGLAVFNLPPGFDVPAIDAANHTVKHEAGHAYLRRLERLTGIPRTVYVENFRVRFGYPADYAVIGYSAGYVSLGEAWAEVFCNACEGAVVTSKSHLDELVDPLIARAWFQSQDPVWVPPPPPPTFDIEWLGPCRTGNFTPGREGNPIVLIVDHWTVGAFQSAIDRFTNTNDRLSAHYVISQTGRIAQVVREEDTAHHAGIFDVNLRSIGIEHEASPTLLPSDALYAASAWLHHKLSLDYGIRLVVSESVKPHNAIVPTACPGTLNLDRIVAEAGGEDMDRALFNQWFQEQYLATIDPTIVAMKNAYNPLIPQAHPKSHKHDSVVDLPPTVVTTGEPK